jgi:hypothetical protein
MYQLIYTSQATFSFTDEDLAALLHNSRQRNEQRGLTGVLLYSDNEFLQVLEGEQATITQLYDQLRHDLRHHHLTELAYGPITARRFAEWTMGFQTLVPAQMQQVRGYFEPGRLPMASPSFSSQDTLLVDLLRGFAHTAA